MLLKEKRKTKIICTLGPSTDDENILRQLMLRGMNVARVNMSHQTQEAQRVRINEVKKIREELSLPIALLLDTKGPEIRTGVFESEQVKLVEGQKFTLTTRDIVGDSSISSISYKNLPNDVKPGIRILLDDGLIALDVEGVDKTEIYCHVVNGGVLSACKGINVPNIRLSMPFMSQKDKDDIRFAVEEGFDFIAASFTRSHNDIMTMRDELKKVGGEHIKIIAKIENSDGVHNIDKIIEVADGIMVARGDLGVEVAMEDIPVLQKKLIKKVYDAGKQVVTATQMLDSMMKNPRPTRAEATDVANAIYDGTSAIMLSGETAAGKYPIEALTTMDRIARRTEKDIDYVKRFKKRDSDEIPNITSAISHATCTTAHDLDASAIVTVTKSGKTARMISKYRPSCPIIAGTTDKCVERQLNMSWGVTPILIDEKSSTDELFDHVIQQAEKNNLLQIGDLVAITTGVPLGMSGTTNLLKVHIVGKFYESQSGEYKTYV